MGRPLRLATRTSKLALAQADIVSRSLAHLGVDCEIVGVETTGDADRTSSVVALTEMGAFVRSVQYAVLEGRADVAVHSGKDLPVTGPAGLDQFQLERGPAADALCGLTELPANARIGTGSPRRRAQLMDLAPNLEVVDVRGNVDTRLERCNRDLDGVVLAEAGLIRLGLASRIGRKFSPNEMVPAPAQGAITAEVRKESEAAALVAQIEHEATRRAVAAERRLLERTGAGCRSALGAVAEEVGGGALKMVGFVADERGARRGEAEGDDAETVARALQRELGL